jgi:hypothetical protein
VVGYDCGYLHGQRAGPVAIEQIVDAVLVPGYEYQDARPNIAVIDLSVHLELIGDRFETTLEFSS